MNLYKMEYQLSHLSVFGATISIFGGVLILLLGMHVVSLAVGGVWASVLDVVFVVAGLQFICFNTNMSSLVGKKTVTTFLVIIAVISLFSLWFGYNYVYTSYEDGHYMSMHDEHNLTYQRILAVANELKNGSFTNALFFAQTYGQYAYTYFYSSLIYIFGGDQITLMCVWNGMHLGIMSILSVLVANAGGISERQSLRCVMLLVVLQPVFWTLSAYNRNIVGECFLLLGLLLFVRNSDSPLKLFLYLPAYGFLFYAYRLQYLLIAVSLFLFVSVMSQSKKKGFHISGFFISLAVLLYFMNTVNWATDVGDGLNVNNYVKASRSSLVITLLLGLIGKFPWTNVFFDSNWTYHLFVSLQAPMMLILYYYSYKIYKNRFSDFLFHPITLCGLLLLMAGMISSTHTTYLAVAAPMLIIGVSDIGLGKLEKSYLQVSAVFVIMSILYYALGLTGTGIVSH